MAAALAVAAAAQEPPAATPAAPATAPAAPPAAESPADGADAADAGYRQIEQLARVIELVRENHVDASRTTYEKLMASALEGVLAGLDPHSQFLSPELYEKLQQEQGNTYEGVGITISGRPEGVVIVTVREDGPAARAGVMPGDVIVKIGDRMVEELTVAGAAQALRGRPGETMKLTVQRPSTREFKEFELVRQVLSTVTVKDSLLLDAPLAGAFKIGYVRLLQFTEPTGRELALALDGLEDAGLQALVLDLRNNPGGLITSAVECAGEFLPPGTTVVTTEGRDGKLTSPPYQTPPRKRRERAYPVAVLINHSSASGAELLAGALQDLRRAVIVGETSFGKGSVQSIIPLEGGSAVRLTTAKYYTPSHRTIHEQGIRPDIVATLTPDEEKAVFDFWRRGESVTGDARALARLGDRQLERAATVLKGLLALGK
jgi:carboxyl-terminal processing protease